MAAAIAYVCDWDPEFLNDNYRSNVQIPHETWLPGIECAVCDDAWAATGLSHPLVDGKLVADAAGWRPSKTVSPAEFEALRRKLRRVLPPGLWLAPGAQFGNQDGKFSGVIGDFAWPSPWDLAIRENVYLRMREAGFNVIGKLTTVRSRKNVVERLYELEIWPTARALIKRRKEPCAACGWIGGKVPKRLFLDQDTIRSDTPFQRVLEYPTRIVANAAVAEFIRSNKLTDMRLTRVKVGGR